MQNIPDKLDKINKAEAAANKKGIRIFNKKSGDSRVSDKLRPTRNSDPDQTVTLLYRWKDLYFKAFHVRGTWFRFNDAEEFLPPRDQVQYDMNERVGIQELPINSGYGSYGCIGQFETGRVGSRSFHNCHTSLLSARELHAQHRHGDLHLLLPVVGIAECIRFRKFQSWVASKLSSEDSTEEVIPGEVIPEAHSYDFRHWGDLSYAIFCQTAWGELTYHEICQI
uniref:rRNA N-glycosylase n=1 Tax=Leersia perrieri TaxID=77586 RepID=A0A0D9VPK7_9ORYZ